MPPRLNGDCALSVEESTSIRKKDVNLDAKTLSVSYRKMSSSETATLLKEMPWQGPYVIPAVRNPKTLINRAVMSRQVWQALDKGGFLHLKPSALRTLRIMELLETCPIEEVSRTTGCEVRSLRVLWSRYREEPLPPRPRKATALRKEMGFASGLLDYYIKEALTGGLLQTESMAFAAVYSHIYILLRRHWRGIFPPLL